MAYRSANAIAEREHALEYWLQTRNRKLKIKMKHVYTNLSLFMRITLFPLHDLGVQPPFEHDLLALHLCACQMKVIHTNEYNTF